MAYTPYDWNQAVQQRTDYIEERLRDGSPVVAISLPQGILMASIHQAQRKLFEIYDQIMFGGIGNQSDLETVRSAAIDFAHREGFQRSPDDVTLQRLVGAALSPAIKRAFADPFSAPFVFHGLFAELGDTPTADTYYSLKSDGEFSVRHEFEVIAGTAAAENEMSRRLHQALPEADSLTTGLRLAVDAWALGRLHARRSADESDELAQPSTPPREVVEAELETGSLEAALLERNTRRESRFRLLGPAELEAVLQDYGQGKQVTG
jgi:proteasome alpha subunit